MATTQKKTTGRGTKATASSGGRKSSGSGSRGKKKSTGSKNRSKASRPIYREVGAVICLLLAFFSAFGYFKVDALFINWFCGVAKGVAGYGFWMLSPMLLLASYILFFHRGRPVRLRMWCAMLLPLVFGSILHLFLANPYPLSLAAVKTLWADGQSLHCGGVVGGIVATGFVQIFSKIGSAVVFITGGLLMLLAACNRTVVDLVDAVRSRPRKERSTYDPEDYVQPERKPEPAPAIIPARRKAMIDIPVEGEVRQPSTPTAPAAPIVELPKSDGFFNRKPNVPTPDQVLTGVCTEGEDTVSAPFEEPVTPFAEPVAAPTVPLPEIVREPAVKKMSEQEKTAVVQEIVQEIGASTEPCAYQYPPLSLLIEGSSEVGSGALDELQANQERLTDTIRSFGITASITHVTRGPSVARYEVELDQGVRLNKLTNLSDDIALALGATGVRIAPIPNKSSTVGIEVPNKLVSTVPIHDVVGGKEFCDHRSKVAFAVGKDIAGNNIVGDIAKLPHMLIAGTTGSGKSVCTNSLIISLLYKATPEEVRLIMVDPKMVELGIYNGIPHLLIPVVTDPKKAAGALQWAVAEMMKRYRAFSEAGVRDLSSYNALAVKTEGMEKMPQVVVVIDELADLMLVAAKDVEESICRVAQMGRASGMHLVIATQRPSADVITGLMKANIPSRIAFAVASALESRIILDTQGAEKLVGHGDMLWFPLGAGKPMRVQGCLITDKEVSSVVEFVKKSSTANYSEAVLQEIEHHVAEREKGTKSTGGTVSETADNDYDDLLPAAIDVVVDTGQASVSMLQRRLKLGYSRAARLVDQMEEKGIVGPFEGSKPRQLLITKAQWQEMQFRQGMVDTAPDAEMDTPQGGAAEEDAPPFDRDETSFPDEQA